MGNKSQWEKLKQFDYYRGKIPPAPRINKEETFICKLCKKKKLHNDLDILNFDGDCICADCDRLINDKT